MTQSIQKGLQVTSEGETLILKKYSTKICFDKKMVNKVREGFLFTTKFYNFAIHGSLLYLKKRNPE